MKGVVVVEVVLHHVRTAMEDYGARLPVLALVDDIAAPVRMPLMFLLSGLFAARLVDGPSRRVWRGRIGMLAYLVALWSAISLVVVASAAEVLGKPGGEAVARFGARMLDGVQPLWFLVALAAFTAYARWVRRWPVWAQMLVAIVVALVVQAPGVPGLVWQWWHLPFFLAGLHFPGVVRRAAHSVRADWLGTGRIGRAWAWIGGRTLPVFLVHAVTLPLVVRAVPGDVAGALAAIVVLVATSLGFYAVTSRVPGLWALPGGSRR